MLYVCATPIGNLEDITIRTLNILKEVDYIACEDTRRTLKLLNFYGIKKRLISFNEHSEFFKKDTIINDLKKGFNIALVSDAGMPGIQDPGQILIKNVIENKLEYTVLPGASASITAIVASGLAKDEFVFLGFLPRKKNDRFNILNKYKSIDSEIIIYEAPHRLEKLLKDIYEVYGNRNIVICRELSKKYEEYIHTNIADALEKYYNLKGEIILIIERFLIKENSDILNDDEIDNIILDMKRKNISTKDIVKILVKEKGLAKNIAYKKVIK